MTAIRPRWRGAFVVAVGLALVAGAGGCPEPDDDTVADDDAGDDDGGDDDDVDLLLAPGDLANNDRPGLWWTFFDLGRELLAGTVIVPAVGNHDTPGNGTNSNTAHFDRYFDLPMAAGSEAYYRVDIGPAVFLMASTEIALEKMPWSDQQVWLSQQLSALEGGVVPWVFVSWHIPPFNAGSRHHLQMDDVRALVAGFDGVVDWFFAGHEHLYQRMFPMDESGDLAPSGLYGTGPGEGVGFMVLPPAGAWPNDDLVQHDSIYASYRDWVAYPTFGAWDNQTDSEVGYAIVDVDGGMITIDVWGMGTVSILCFGAPLKCRGKDSSGTILKMESEFTDECECGPNGDQPCPGDLPGACGPAPSDANTNNSETESSD